MSASAQAQEPRLSFLPNFVNPEDLVAMNEHWVIASSLGQPGLYLINVTEKKPTKVDFSKVAVVALHESPGQDFQVIIVC
jgi:hypothetical protein